MDIETTDREFMGSVEVPVQKDWRDVDYFKTLRWVNEVRVTRLGLGPLDDLLPGTCGRPLRCVIARSLPGAQVGGPVMVFQGKQENLPPYVALFVLHFDGHCYPALEKP